MTRLRITPTVTLEPDEVAAVHITLHEPAPVGEALERWYVTLRDVYGACWLVAEQMPVDAAREAYRALRSFKTLAA